MPEKTNRPSARSKKADQKYISIAEVKGDKRLVRELGGSFEFIEADFKNSGKAWERLKATAKRAGMKPLEYFFKKIAPKLL